MKDLLRNLAGGLAVIAAGALIGVLHNAVRGQSIPLVQNVEVVKTANRGGGGDHKNDPGAVDRSQATARLPEGAVTVEQVKAMFDAGGVYIVDSRAPEVFAEGHIPGAINVPYDRLPEYYEDFTAAVPTDAKIVCYCWSPTCDFSDQLATELKILGYSEVVVFTGGWEHWQEAGHPTEGPDSEG